MKAQIQFGNITIFLPDENSSQFFIFHDLADLFNLEFQSEAVSVLKKALKSVELKPKPSIDYEADRTSIRTSNPNTIFGIAQIINDLSINEKKVNLSAQELNQIKTQLETWERPKPQQWKVGDLFSIKLKDGDYAFGQIIGQHPTFALFDIKSKNESISTEQLKKAGVVTVLHLMDTRINNFKWKILSHSAQLFAKSDSGPWGAEGKKSGSSGFLETVAKYYWFKEHDWANENDVKALILIKPKLLSRLFGSK